MRRLPGTEYVALKEERIMSARAYARMFVALLVGSVLLTAATQAQTTWYVDDDAPNDPGPGDPLVSDPLEDGSAAHPFDAIQEGIDVAQEGDTVLVADGTYTGPGNSFVSFAGKAITVRSENGPAGCIIEDGWFEFSDGETGLSVLNGFTISEAFICAIECWESSPTIINCTITDTYVDADICLLAILCG